MDGRYLYFLSDRDGADNVWRVPVDEASGRARGAPEPVTSGTSAVASFDVTPDGGRIALTELAYQGQMEIVEFDPTTETLGTARPILPSLAAVPDLSPDGKRIAFMTVLPREDIHVVGADGTALRRLTDDEYRDRFPRWSPAGDQIAFFSNRSGKYEIWTIRPDGSGLTQRTHHPAADLLSPLWAPDGTKLTCFAPGGGNFFAELGDRPAMLEAGSLRPLPPLDREGKIFRPASWSPDGRLLAGIVEGADRAATGLATLSLGSGEYTIHEIFDKPTRVEMLFPEWLPDGERLVYDREDRLFVFDIRSGQEREIPTPAVQPGEWRDYFPSWDGRAFFQIRGSYNADVWLGDLEEGR
jgi:Tol biopolymer transport system component